MKVCVQGLWHLGTVTAACLASLGHEVIGLDFDADVVEGLNRGSPPLLEPGLEPLVKAGLASGRLRFTSSAEKALQDIEVLWVAYDTPVDDEDTADVDYVFNQVQRTLSGIPERSTVLISSQLPVGSVRRLEAFATKHFPNKALGFACSPENLRLGKALEAFLKPDRIVVGVRSERDRERLELLLRRITDRVEWMSVESAEMSKHAINAFLATSVVFANEIASICELAGADAKEVERGLKTESRIGPKAYLSPGAAFSGGTLARDIAFLEKVGGTGRLITPLLSSVRASNDEHKQWVQRKLQSMFPDLSRAAVAVWGLTYKPGTDTLRRSAAVELCDWLLERHAKVRVHDPMAGELPAGWEQRVTRFSDPLAALSDAQVLVVSTEWPQYKEISVNAIARNAPGVVVLDANRFLPGLATEPNLTYMAVGTPSRVQAAVKSG